MTVLGKRVTLEVVLRYWSCKWIKIPSSGGKVSLLWVFLRKNGTLSGLGYQGLFLALLVVDYAVVVDQLHVCDCKGGCVWTTWNLWRNVLRSVAGKTESEDGVRSIYIWYLAVVVKRLCCIDCLNPWVIKLTVPLSEAKSFFVVLSFHIKMMQRGTLQACSLKHSIKKACFSV